MTYERPEPPQRIERRELYAAVWEEPATTVAARYSITSTALAKICHKLRVPTPPRGYWAKRAAGHRVARAPLPPLMPGQRTVHGDHVAGDARTRSCSSIVRSAS